MNWRIIRTMKKNSSVCETEQERLFRITEFERPYWNCGISVAGMDEVGRGPLAGPVVAACVIMPSIPLIEGINDSKRISARKREKLYDEIKHYALAYGFGWVWQGKIDEINILEATKLAFANAYRDMKIACDDVFVDAVKDIAIPAKQHSIIHGDELCYSIAAASIIAKVERDRFMVSISERYPQYGFDKNKGYGTKQHIDALRQFGPCELHRRTFIGKIIN